MDIHKKAIFAAAMLALVGMGLSLRADIKYFWLDHPKGRTNPNDPQSPLHAVTATPGLLPLGTLTATPTATPSNTPNLPAGTNTVSPTITLTWTLTATPTPSATPTATQTLCVMSTPSLMIENFEGDAPAGPSGNYLGPAGIPETVTVVQPGDCSTQSLLLAITFTASSGWGSFYGFNGLSASLNVSNATALVFDIQTNENLDLALVAFTGSSGVYSTKVEINGLMVQAENGWQHIVVPVSSMENMLTPASCTWGACSAWAPAASDSVAAFEIDVNNNLGNYNPTFIYLDNIGFITTTPPPQPIAFEQFGEPWWTSMPASTLAYDVADAGSGITAGTPVGEGSNLVPGEQGQACEQTQDFTSASAWNELEIANAGSYGGSINVSTADNTLTFEAYTSAGPLDISPAIEDGSSTIADYQGPTIVLQPGSWQQISVTLNATNFTNYATLDFTHISWVDFTTQPDASATLPVNTTFYVDDIIFNP